MVADSVVEQLPDLKDDPRAVRVMKKPLPVDVIFAETDGVCLTLEGAVTYSAGDAIVSGVHGEAWPIELANFERTYEPVLPTISGLPGHYVKKTITVWGKCLDQKVQVLIKPGSPIEGDVGDWLVQYSPGRYGIVSREIFEESYLIV